MVWGLYNVIIGMSASNQWVTAYQPQLPGTVLLRSNFVKLTGCSSKSFVAETDAREVAIHRLLDRLPVIKGRQESWGRDPVFYLKKTELRLDRSAGFTSP